MNKTYVVVYLSIKRADERKQSSILHAVQISKEYLRVFQKPRSHLIMSDNLPQIVMRKM